MRRFCGRPANHMHGFSGGSTNENYVCEITSGRFVRRQRDQFRHLRHCQMASGQLVRSVVLVADRGFTFCIISAPCSYIVLRRRIARRVAQTKPNLFTQRGSEFDANSSAELQQQYPSMEQAPRKEEKKKGRMLLLLVRAYQAISASYLLAAARASRRENKPSYFLTIALHGHHDQKKKEKQEENRCDQLKHQHDYGDHR